MKVLLLGGNGQTGRLLAPALEGAKTPTRAECDVTKQADLERALEGCDAVVASELKAAAQVGKMPVVCG